MLDGYIAALYIVYMRRGEEAGRQRELTVTRLFIQTTFPDGMMCDFWGNLRAAREAAADGARVQVRTSYEADPTPVYATSRLRRQRYEEALGASLDTNGEFSQAEHVKTGRRVLKRRGWEYFSGRSCEVRPCGAHTRTTTSGRSVLFTY